MWKKTKMTRNKRNDLQGNVEAVPRQKELKEATGKSNL